MRYEELDEEVLIEASFKYTKSFEDQAVFFYGTKKARMPNVVIYNEDHDHYMMHDATTFTIATLKTRKIEQKINELLRKKNRLIAYSGDLSEEDQEFLNAFVKLSGRKERDPFYVKEFKDYVTTYNFYDRESFYKFVTTDLGMVTVTFEHFFGSVPTWLHGDEYESFHDAKLFFPDNIRESNKKRMLEFVATFESLLNKKNLGYLFDGMDIRFTKLPGNTIGQYSVKTKDIRIQPLVKKSKSVLSTIIHEFGHKFWYEYSAQDTRTEIRRMFDEISSAEHTYQPTSNFDQRKSEILNDLQPGMVVNYNGRKAGYKQNAPFVVNRIEGETVYLAPEYYPEKAVVWGSTGFLMKKQWDVVDVDTSYEESDDHRQTEDWFPTKYSHTDYEEWFCELFSFYGMDMLQGEPLVWIKKVLGAGK